MDISDVVDMITGSIVTISIVGGMVLWVLATLAIVKWLRRAV